MNVLEGYPPYRGPKTGPEVRWYFQAEDMWRNWGHKLDEQQRQTWFQAVASLKTKESQNVWEQHELAQGKHNMTWVQWTFLRIMFQYKPGSMLKTLAAVWVQANYPWADLSCWNLNDEGPTTHVHFRESIWYPRLPETIKAEINKRVPLAMPHSEPKTTQSNTSNANKRPDKRPDAGKEDEVSSAKKVPIRTTQQPHNGNHQARPTSKRDATPLANAPKRAKRDTNLPDMLAGILEKMNQLGPDFATNEGAGPDDTLAKLEFVVSDMRMKQHRDLQSEVVGLKQQLDKAAARITALETARDGQEKERQALCTALSQAMGTG